MADGDFTGSAITQNLIKAELAWPTAPKRQFKKAKTSLGALHGVMTEGSNIPISNIKNGNDVCNYTLTWHSACDDTPSDCTTDVCAVPSGDKGEVETKEYEITGCVEKTWTVDTSDGLCNTSAFQERFNQLLWSKMLAAEIEIDRAILTVLNTNTQAVTGLPSHYQQAGTGPVQIPSSSFNSSKVADLALIGIHNDLENSYIIDNGKFFKAEFMATVDASNPQNTDMQRWDSVLGAVYGDVKNIPAIAPGVQFMIEQDAVKFTHLYFETPEKQATKPNGDGFTSPFHSRIESVFTPGLWYDMRTSIQCVDTNGERQYIYNYAIRVKHDTQTRPIQCADGQTGIIALQCA